MDRGGFQQKTITFVIKTPNMAHGDQTVEGVDLDWTVVDLKRHLSAVYPSQPAVTDQRLIFSGKLLPDHLHLRDIFRQTDCAPTLHLVCSARAPARGPLGARPKVRETEQQNQAASASTVQTSVSSSASPSSPVQSTPTPPPVQSTPTPPPVQSTPTPPPVQSTPTPPPVQSPPTTPELRQRRHAAPAASTPRPDHTQAQTPAWPGMAVPGVAELAQPAFPTYSLYSPQQLLWLQHVYARQYYMQYHAALAAAGHSTASMAPAATTFGPYPPVPAHHQAPVPAALPNQNPIEPLPANQNAGAQDGGAFIDPAAANQNLRMNAQGGPVMEDEEDVDRDWLDWVYTVARLGVFLSIVYFYSTLSRFVLVMSSLLLMYLHTAGWFPFRRRALVQGPNLQQPQAQQPPQAQQNPAPGEEPADGERVGQDAAGEGPEAQGPMAAVLVPAHRVSVMWTAWVFFKSFFSSLIPEAQQGLAN